MPIADHRDLRVVSSAVQVGDLVPLNQGLFPGPNTWAKVVRILEFADGELVFVTRTGRNVCADRDSVIRVRRKS